MGDLDGKVAFITGAARGQGRNHAVRLAQAGADIIAVDICEQVPSLAAPLAVPEDLEETTRQVEATGRRIHAAQVDVRDEATLRSAYERGVAELGVADIVVANAGVGPHGQYEPDMPGLFRDVVMINLVGTWNTLHVAVPSMLEAGKAGSLVLIASTQSHVGRGGDGSAGAAAYTASKHGVAGLMKSFGYWLAPHGIRVNAISPTGVDTDMVHNEVVSRWVAENPDGAAASANLMDVPLVTPDDVTEALLYLVSERGRYVTGLNLTVDAGFLLR